MVELLVLLGNKTGTYSCVVIVVTQTNKTRSSQNISNVNNVELLAMVFTNWRIRSYPKSAAKKIICLFNHSQFRMGKWSHLLVDVKININLSLKKVIGQLMNLYDSRSRKRRRGRYAILLKTTYLLLKKHTFLILQNHLLLSRKGCKIIFWMVIYVYY